MITNKSLFIIFIFLTLSACNAQKVKSKTTPIKTLYEPNTSFYFESNTLELDAESKKLLDYFGSGFKKGVLSGDKYDFYLQVISNKEEIKENKYLYSNRIVYILDYLEEKYQIPKKILW